MCRALYFVYYFAIYVLLVVSISADYWASDGYNHKGLWSQCNYMTNITITRRNGTCCAPVQYKAYIGATRAFFIIDLILHGGVIVAFVLSDCFSNPEFDKVVVTSLIMSFVSILLLIPIGTYAGKLEDGFSFAWSYYILLTCFLLRIINALIYGCYYTLYL